MADRAPTGGLSWRRVDDLDVEVTTHLGGRSWWDLQRWTPEVTSVAVAVFYREPDADRAHPVVHLVGDWTPVLEALWDSGTHWMDVLPRLQALRAHLPLTSLRLLAQEIGAIAALETRL